jgi:hypothetical protein
MCLQVLLIRFGWIWIRKNDADRSRSGSGSTTLVGIRYGTVPFSTGRALHTGTGVLFVMLYGCSTYHRILGIGTDKITVC